MLSVQRGPVLQLRREIRQQGACCLVLPVLSTNPVCPSGHPAAPLLSLVSRTNPPTPRCSKHRIRAIVNSSTINFQVLPGGEAPGHKAEWVPAPIEARQGGSLEHGAGSSKLSSPKAVQLALACVSCVSLQLQPWREEAPQPPTQATMSADTLQVLASAGQGKTTRGLLRVIILALIAAAAIASRLFSVIRTCPVSPLPPLVVMASWSSGCHIGHARASRNPPIIQRVGLWSSWHANQVLSSLCRIREYYP